MSPRLEAARIQKTFAGVRVLKGVSFEVARGETLGIVGENGAGKSTLMNVLGGVLRPDEGTLRLDGEAYAPDGPRDARARGVAFIHQELNLFPNLSVAENLSLVDFPRRYGFVDRTALAARAREALGRVGLDLDPARRVADLGPGIRQLVEIARAVSAEARVVILDEPTTSLTRPEIGRLFAVLGQLRREGRALLYVSHMLSDVRLLCDRIVVLRDGEPVGEGPTAELPEERLVALMAGRPLSTVFPPRAAGRARPLATSVPALEVAGLGRRGAFEDIDLALWPGEVLGIAGLVGAGRTELLRALFGLEPADRGQVRLFGEPFVPTPRGAIARGLGLVTEERRADGLLLDASVERNLELGALPRFAGPLLGRVRAAALGAALAETTRSVRLDPLARLGQPVRTLSGGNQQRVVIGKWLLTKPRIVLLDEPTRGIDVSAKQQIYRLITDLADRGAAVLIVASEIEELVGLCDRMVALSLGRLVGEWPRAAFDAETILAACLGAGGPPGPPS